MKQETKAGPCGFHGPVLEFEGTLGFLMALHEVQGLFLPIVPSVRRRLTDVLIARAEASWLTNMESWAAGRNEIRLTAEEKNRFAVAAGNAEAQWLNEVLADRESPLQAVDHDVSDRMKVHRLMTDAGTHRGAAGVVQESRLEFVCECLVHGLRPAPASPWSAGGVEERLSEWAREIASGLCYQHREGGLVDQNSAILAVAGDDRDRLVDVGRVVSRMRGLSRLEPRGDLWMADLGESASILGGLAARIADESGQEVFSSLPVFPTRTETLMNRRRELFEDWTRQTGVEFCGPFGGPRKPILEALADA